MIRNIAPAEPQLITQVQVYFKTFDNKLVIYKEPPR